jgi:hypothetical protein
VTRAKAEVPPFGEIAAQLVENGFQPIPLTFDDKRPVVYGWPNYQFDPASRDEFSRPLGMFMRKLRYPHYATGAVTGKVIAVDVDARDEKVVRKIKALTDKLLGPGPDRVGHAPKMLRLFQAKKPFVKMSTQNFSLSGDDIDAPGYKHHLVEILGTGHQCVLYAIHNKTGRPYQWVSGGEPLTMPVKKLIVVTEAQCREYIHQVEKLLLKCGAKPHGRSRTATSRHTAGQPSSTPASKRKSSAGWPKATARSRSVANWASVRRPCNALRRIARPPRNASASFFFSRRCNTDD